MAFYFFVAVLYEHVALVFVRCQRLVCDKVAGILVEKRGAVSNVRVQNDVNLPVFWAATRTPRTNPVTLRHFFFFS